MKNSFTLRAAGTLILLASLLPASPAAGGEAAAVNPGPKDKCPVCGMFVAPYRDWVAEIVFKDGSRAFFDGTKDMLKCYFDMTKYRKGKTKDDVAEIYVTDYYRVTMMPAGEAFFVLGSDVNGPMGRELIPLKDRREAAEFMKDHGGGKILTFDQITPEHIPN